MNTTDIDNSEQREAFAQSLVTDLMASMETLGVWLGLRLGLYAALDRAGVSTATELASNAGIDTRYAREWLEQQAVAGVLVTTEAGRDAENRRYELPAAHREVLLDEVSPYFVAPASYALAGVARVLPELLTAYRTGAGVPYAAYGDEIRDHIEQLNRPMFVNDLAANWLPAVPDLHARLQADPPTCGRRTCSWCSTTANTCSTPQSVPPTLASVVDWSYRCGPEEAIWAEALATALDDLRGAHLWALDHEPALAIRLSSGLFWNGETGAPSEVPAWAARAAGVAEQDPLLPVALAAAAGVRFGGDFAAATSFAHRALQAAANDDPVRRYALHPLGELALHEGHLDDAVELFTEVAELADKAGDTYFTAYAAVTRSLSQAYQGNTGAAVELAHRAKRLATVIGNPSTLAWAEYALGEALLDQEPDRAREAVNFALVAAHAARNRFVLGVSQVSAASLHARHGDPHQALRLFDEAVDYWSQAGNWTQQWITLRNVIDLLIRLKADDSAAVIYGALTASATATPVYGTDAERLAAHATGLRARLGAATFIAALARGRALGDAEVIPFTRTALADLAPGSSVFSPDGRVADH